MPKLPTDYKNMPKYEGKISIATFLFGVFVSGLLLIVLGFLATM